jgi:hypothetical protein
MIRGSGGAGDPALFPARDPCHGNQEDSDHGTGDQAGKDRDEVFGHSGQCSALQKRNGVLRQDLRRWPPLENDLGVGRIHPITPRVRIPGDEVPPGDAPHHLVRASDDTSEGGTRALPIPGG